MRKDMAKVLVERPRLKGKNDPWRKSDLVYRDTLYKEGVRPISDRKQLNENLKPLIRFCQKQVGRPWDKVYSEIREQIDCRSAVQKHILEHLGQIVSVNVVVEGKAVRAKDWLFPLQPGSLYVDPNTGILRRTKVTKKPRMNYRVPKLEAGAYFMQDDHGIWYEVTLSEVPDNTKGLYDVWRGTSAIPEKTNQWHQGGPYGNTHVYASHKRQLSSREIKKHGLGEA